MRRCIFVISVGGIRKSNGSERSCEWPERKFHWLCLELSRQLVESLHVTNCWRSCRRSSSGTLVATLKLCPTLQPIYLSQKAPEPCMHCRCTVEIFFRVSFYWDLLQLLDGLFVANLNARSRLRIFRPTNSFFCLVRVTSFQSFEPTWNVIEVWIKHVIPFRFHLFRNDHLARRLMILDTDFPVAGLPAIGSRISSNAASASVITHGLVEMLLRIVPLCGVILVPGSLTRLY